MYTVYYIYYCVMCHIYTIQYIIGTVHYVRTVHNTWGGGPTPFLPMGKLCLFPFFPMGKMGKDTFFPWAKMGLDPPNTYRMHYALYSLHYLLLV